MVQTPEFLWVFYDVGSYGGIDPTATGHRRIRERERERERETHTFERKRKMSNGGLIGLGLKD